MFNVRVSRSSSATVAQTRFAATVFPSALSGTVIAISLSAQIDVFSCPSSMQRIL